MLLQMDNVRVLFRVRGPGFDTNFRADLTIQLNAGAFLELEAELNWGVELSSAVARKGNIRAHRNITGSERV